MQRVAQESGQGQCLREPCSCTLTRQGSLRDLRRQPALTQRAASQPSAPTLRMRAQVLIDSESTPGVTRMGGRAPARPCGSARVPSLDSRRRAPQGHRPSRAAAASESVRVQRRLLPGFRRPSAPVVRPPAPVPAPASANHAVVQSRRLRTTGPDSGHGRLVAREVGSDCSIPNRLISHDVESVKVVPGRAAYMPMRSRSLCPAYAQAHDLTALNSDAGAIEGPAPPRARIVRGRRPA